MKMADGKDTNVLSKTPDDIKKSLKRCGKDRNCHKFCSYWDIEDCTGELFKDALAYIQQLERERDAAIEDIKKAALFLCQTCKKYHPAVIDGTKHFCDAIPADHFDDGAIVCGMYEWRGVEENENHFREVPKMQTSWISIAERQPELNEKTLVCVERPMFSIKTHFTVDTAFYIGNGVWQYKFEKRPHVTYRPKYWMPLPEPPKEEYE